MAFNEDLDPNGKTGKRLTILSIDGGGVRGIIPATILQKLDGYLASEELKRPGNTGKHHLFEYFDMIAGTSSGGLITAMITTPSANGSREPCFNATKVVEFFEQDAVKIFPATFTNKVRLRWLLEGFASVFGPIYSAKPLEDLLREKFRDTHLSDALTSVIIPAFDTNDEVPVFFSNKKGVDSAKPLYDVQVKDACRATTAVPIFFPAANIKENQNQSGRPIKEFNVIDGGIAVNDPTLVAVTQEIAKKRQAILQELQAIAEVRRAILEEDLQANAVDRREILEEDLRANAVDRREILEEDLRANAVDRRAKLEEDLRANAVDRRAILEEDLRANAVDRRAILEEDLRAIAEVRRAILEEELRSIAEVRRAILEEERKAIAEERSRDCMDFSNVLVLSLGTGEHRMRFIAKPHWSSVQWLLNPTGSPLLSSFLSASEDMVEYYTSMIFDAHQSGHHYLRIQTKRLSTSEFWGIDDATKQNLDKLTEKARKLLGKNVKKRNFATGKLDAITGGGSNEQALRRFARWLVEERRERPQTTRQQTAGESSGNADLPGNYGQQTAVDCCRSMMRTAVGGCFLMMRTAFGGCWLTLTAVILVFVCSVHGIFCLLQVAAVGIVYLFSVAAVGIGNLLRVAVVGIGNLFSVRLVRAHLD